MPDGNSRIDLQRLAEMKFSDAALLLQHKRFSNAYYLAGYALEIGLKACIAKQIIAETIPPRRFINDVNTHDLEKLISAAGLKQALREKQDQDQTFQAYWGLAGDWSPEVRYESVDAIAAQLLLKAVGDPTNGILPWIKTVW
jgi:hypothetical protein